MMRIIHITRWALISVMTSVLLTIDSAHGLTSCQTENPVSSWHECTGTMKSPDGSTYEGDWFDGRPHGQGILSSADGSAYVGEFRSGIRVGLGAMAYASGDRYAGYWKDSKPFGFGGIFLADGTIYLGQWEDAQFHGTGVMIRDNDEKVIATWEKGLNKAALPATKTNNGWLIAGGKGKPYYGGKTLKAYNGAGFAASPKGEVYVGEFKRGEYHGEGAFFGENRLFVGDWKFNRLTGPAATISQAGALIFGDWNSLVIARKSDGEVYRGSFENIPRPFLYDNSYHGSNKGDLPTVGDRNILSNTRGKVFGVYSGTRSESTESTQNPESGPQPNDSAERNEIIPEAEQSLLASDSVDNAPNQPLSDDLPEPEKIRSVREKKSNSDELKWGLDALDGRQIICEASDEPIFPTIGVQGFRFVGEKVREDVFFVDRGNVIIKVHGSGRVKKVGLKKVEFLGNNEILWELDRETLALKAGEMTEQSNIMQCEVPENLKDYDAKMEQHRLKSLDTLKAEIKKNKI